MPLLRGVGHQRESQCVRATLRDALGVVACLAKLCRFQLPAEDEQRHYCDFSFFFYFGSKLPSSNFLFSCSSVMPWITSNGSMTLPSDLLIFRPWASRTIACKKTWQRKKKKYMYLTYLHKFQQIIKKKSHCQKDFNSIKSQRSLQISMHYAPPPPRNFFKKKS